MTYALASINPFLAARSRRLVSPPRTEPNPAAHAKPVRKVQIGPATLYNGDCFDVMPTLEPVEGVVTDPPYGIGFKYRSYDDAPERYDILMWKLVPLLTRLSGGGPCFVWQSPLKADQWHKYFPEDYRILAGCKLYPQAKRQAALPQLGPDHLLESEDPAVEGSAARLAPRGPGALRRLPRRQSRPLPAPARPGGVHLPRDLGKNYRSTRSWAAAPPASPASTPARSSSASSKTACISSTPASASARRGRPSAVHPKPLDPARAPGPLTTGQARSAGP